MSYSPDSHTHQSLIMHMAEGGSSSDSWALFIDKYGPKLYFWSMQWCANHHDAEELVQETTLVVFRKIGVFRIRALGGFRAWLKEIAFHCWQKMLTSKKKFERPMHDPLLAHFKHSQMIDQMARTDLEALFDSIADQEILDLAMFKAKSKFREKTWRIFELIDLECKTVDQVAEQQNVSRGAVHTAVYKVRKLIREEIDNLGISMLSPTIPHDLTPAYDNA